MGRRHQRFRKGHHAWSELTVGLQRFYLRRRGIGGAERVEHGAYLKYGRRPVSLRRNPRGGQKSSTSSKLRTSSRRLKYAPQGGPHRARRGPQGPTEAGASALARGWLWCECMDLQYRATVGAVLRTQGAREGYSTRRCHGGVTGWVYSTYRWGGRCYRPRARERVYSIRRGHRGVRGVGHRTRVRCYRGYRSRRDRRGYKTRRDRREYSTRRGCRGVRWVSHRTRVRCYRSGACKRGYSARRDRRGSSTRRD